ncbi:hypothetical protein ACQ86N_24765 [Puia sp. P3]|uniref:hypothetical protein n=1 Tax=Puia sp. P3 TaxID=3423952 RepID=UPI003D67AF41
MKNNLPALVAGLILLAAPACKKNETVKDIAGAKFCPILQLTSLDTAMGGGPAATVVIHYNAAGNPVEMLDLSPVSPSRVKVDWHFRYDRHNRLTDYLMNPTPLPSPSNGTPIPTPRQISSWIPCMAKTTAR